MKGKELKNDGLKLKLNGVVIEMKLNMNTFCELEEMYEDPFQVIESLQGHSFKATRAIVWANYKNIDKDITLEQVGEMMDIDCMTEVADIISALTGLSLPDATEDIEDEEVENKDQGE